MITLSNPSLVKSVLGGLDNVAYEKFVLESITYNTVAMTARATVRLTSTSQPTMQPIPGVLTVNCATAMLNIEVPALDFYRQITLTGPQNDAMMTFIRNTQNVLEAGLVSVSVIDGTQETGA